MGGGDGKSHEKLLPAPGRTAIIGAPARALVSANHASLLIVEVNRNDRGWGIVGLREGDLLPVQPGVLGVKQCALAASRPYIVAHHRNRPKRGGAVGEHARPALGSAVFEITQCSNPPSGMEGLESVDGYAQAVLKSHFEQPGDDDVLRKVSKDLAASGLAVSEDEVRAKMDEFLAVARGQLRGEV